MKTKLAFSLPTIILGILIAIAPISFAPVCGPMEMPMDGGASTMKMDKEGSMKDMKNMESGDKKDMGAKDMDTEKMNHDDMKNMESGDMKQDEMGHGKDMEEGQTQALHVHTHKGGPKWMKCHWTGEASKGIGTVIALLGVLVFFGDPRMRAGLNLAVVLVSALELAIVHFLIGMCMNPSMHCNTLTKPTLTLLSVLALILGAVFAYLDLRRPVTTEGKLAQ